MQTPRYPMAHHACRLHAPTSIHLASAGWCHRNHCSTFLQVHCATVSAALLLLVSAFGLVGCTASAAGRMGPSCVTIGEPAKAVCSVPCGEGVVMLVTTCINSAGLPAPDSLCGGCKLEPTATICAPGPCTRARRADNSGCIFRIGIFRGTAACSQPDGGQLLAIPSDPAQPQQSLCIASLLFPTVSGLYERWAKLSGLGAMLSVSVYTDALCTVPATAVSSMSDGAPSEVFTIREGSCNTRDTGE